MYVMSRMVECLNANTKGNIPSHKEIRAKMERLRVDLQDKLGTLLLHQWVTISSDGWTSRAGDTYLGVTYHFINSDWILRSVTVDCEKLEGSTTGEQLTHKVPTAWDRSGCAGVTANVTDCEPAMVKMGRMVWEDCGVPHYGCSYHCLEKTAEAFYKHPGVATSLEKIKSVVTHVHKSSQVCSLCLHAHATTSIRTQPVPYSYITIIKRGCIHDSARTS
jgi:hypothetical protein